RHPDYPAVLTMAESGFPGFEQYTQGLGVVAPAGTPAPVVDKLNAAVRASLAKPETKEKLKGLGAITQGGSSPAEFRAWLQTDAERAAALRSEEHTSELQSRGHLVCRLLLEKKKKKNKEDI